MKTSLYGLSICIPLFFLMTCSWEPALESSPEIIIGSKKFTESVVLGEMAAQLIQEGGSIPNHRSELGGTRVLWGALLRGDIDLYPEYTGTITEEIFAGHGLNNLQEMHRTLDGYEIGMTAPLGFNNTYAIGMKEEKAEALKIQKISDLRRHPDLRLGFGNEFIDRADGWPSLRRHYRLPQQNVRGLDHDLAYRGLDNGSLDVTDLYATDAEIEYYNLRVLEDDLEHFPSYDALFLYRKDLKKRAPKALAALSRLEERISDTQMIRMNARVKLEGIPENRVARDFLAENLTLKTQMRERTPLDRFWQSTGEHLFLVTVSLTAAIGAAIPLGITAAKRPKLGQLILGTVGIIQTIPSLALLVFMIPLLGIGGPPAILALFLYSLLPIVRNTYTGLHNIPNDITESAQAMGLPPRARLTRVELPLASRSILAGIKISAVINVGTATLGALIGAGGYGQAILTGIRLDDMGLILQGAVPAAGLALLVQGGFELAERFLIPKGLRLARTLRE